MAKFDEGWFAGALLVHSLLTGLYFHSLGVCLLEVLLMNTLEYKTGCNAAFLLNQITS
jgi:hypothetical protein